MNSIPVIGWALSLFFTASTSVPFWFIWTVCGIGRKFFYWLPTVYQSLGFWETVGLFMAVGILKGLLTPTLAEVSQTNNKEK